MPLTVGMSFNEPCVVEALGEETRAAGLLVVLRGVLAAGREVADEGRALGDVVEVVHGERDVELARDGDEVEHGVGAAAGGGDGGDGVLDGLAGEDFARLICLRASSMTMRPASRLAACFSGDMAGTPVSWMGEMPRNSPAMAMVLAVNWPPQAPGPGQAAASRASSWSSLILPAACEPMPSKT